MSQLRRSPRLAAKQAIQTPDKELFLCRRSNRLAKKRYMARGILIERYRNAKKHTNYYTMMDVTNIHDVAVRLKHMYSDIQNTRDYTEQVKKIINLYDFTLITPIVHDILATLPSFRATTLSKITEFCDYLPYNTKLRIQRSNLCRLYVDLTGHRFYVPDTLEAY